MLLVSGHGLGPRALGVSRGSAGPVAENISVSFHNVDGCPASPHSLWKNGPWIHLGQLRSGNRQEGRGNPPCGGPFPPKRAMASHLLRHLRGDHKPHSAEAWAHSGVSMDDTSCEVKFQRYSTAALSSQLPTLLRSQTHICNLTRRCGTVSHESTAFQEHLSFWTDHNK